MSNQNQNESESNQIKELEAEIANFEEEYKAAETRVQQFLADEDLKNGVYHNEEIFALKQDKLRLKTEILFRSNKINRLRFT